MKRIAVIPGDGIGIDVTREAVRRPAFAIQFLCAGDCSRGSRHL